MWGEIKGGLFSEGSFCHFGPILKIEQNKNQHTNADFGPIGYAKDMPYHAVLFFTSGLAFCCIAA